MRSTGIWLLLGVAAAVVAPSLERSAVANGISPSFLLNTSQSTSSDLPLPTVDLTAEGTADWALWGESELPTPGSLTPDASRNGGGNIGLLQNLMAAHAIFDFSQFSLSPPFSWTDGDPIGDVTGTDVPAALVSRGNGVGSGFEIAITLTPDVDEVVFYGQLFQATGLFTADIDGVALTSLVTSQAPGQLGDTGAVFTLSDFEFETPTATLNLTWEMTEAFGNANNIPSIGLSAITVSTVIPEPGTAAAMVLMVGIGAAGRRRS